MAYNNIIDAEINHAIDMLVTAIRMLEDLSDQEVDFNNADILKVKECIAKLESLL